MRRVYGHPVTTICFARTPILRNTSKNTLVPSETYLSILTYNHATYCINYIIIIIPNKWPYKRVSPI